MAKAGKPAFVVRSLGTVLHIPVDGGLEQIKKIANAPEGYEFTCLLTIGYPAQDTFLPNFFKFSQLFL
jgi:hypothetical protein